MQLLLVGEYKWVFFSKNVIIYRFHYIKLIDKFKFIIHIYNLLKFLILLLLCKQSDLSIRTLWPVHTILQQSHANLSVCSVQYLNPLVSQFELSNHVLGLCWYQHWGQVFLSSKIFCCNDQLIPRSIKRAEIRLCQCKILYQSELFVVVFLENFEF